MAHLEQKLQQFKDKRLRVIINDGVYSMDGDAAKLDEIVKLGLTPAQSAEIKKQIGFELKEIYLSKRSLNKLRVFRLRLNEEQQQALEDKWGQKVRELTVTRSVATRIL